MKSNADKVDDVLTEILSHDSIERDYESKVTKADTRAAQCRRLADGFFKTRGMHPVAQDVKALSLLLYRVTAPRPPGRPRKVRSTA